MPKSRLVASRTKTLARGIYDQIREVMSMQGQLSVERMCYLAQGNRAEFSFALTFNTQKHIYQLR